MLGYVVAASEQGACAPVHAVDLFFFLRDRWFSVKVSVSGAAINHFYSTPSDTHKHIHPKMMLLGGLNMLEMGFSLSSM